MILDRSSVYHVDLLKVESLSLNQISREYTFESMNGVSVFVLFIHVDYDGEEVIGPKWLVP